MQSVVLKKGTHRLCFENRQVGWRVPNFVTRARRVDFKQTVSSGTRDMATDGGQDGSTYVVLLQQYTLMSFDRSTELYLSAT